MSLLQVEKVGRSFVLGGHTVEAVREISFALEEGASLGLVGVSGAGKSTLLHMIGGLERPTRGKILYRDKPLYEGRNDKQLDSYRLREIGFVFQFHYLVEELDALENVALPLRIQRVAPAQATARATKILKEVGLADRLRHRPAQLSGGEQQRVSVARALVHEPALLLADEPTGNLDRKTGDTVATMLVDMCSRRGMSMVVTTHNVAVAEMMGQTLTMADGTVEKVS